MIHSIRRAVGTLAVGAGLVLGTAGIAEAAPSGVDWGTAELVALPDSCLLGLADGEESWVAAD